MSKNNNTKVRIIKYDSDSYITNGNYKEAVYQSLKESGVFSAKRINSQSLNYTKARVIV
ncbi:MAG: hypothetical protein IKA31_01100 [Clostridia bacterium]|nr:hypothetical protein [Clostridia bacterium]